MDVQLVLLGDGLADGLEDRLDALALGLALDLLDDDQPLLAAGLDRERRAALEPERGVAPLDGPLDVLGVDVAAPDDDQVLEPAGDEQLAVVEEAEVAGAQERPLAGVGQGAAERPLGRLGAVPVALRDARAGDPDLADPVGGASGPGLGVDDRDHLVVGDPAGADQRPRPRVVGGGEGDPVPRERLGPDRPDDGGGRLRAAGDHQRRLGQAVAGQEGLAAEAAGPERLGEAVERLRPDRLGAVEGDRPVAQVEPRPLLGRGLADAEVVGEVGPAADRRPGPGDRLRASGSGAAGRRPATGACSSRRSRASGARRRSAPCRGRGGARRRPGSRASTRSSGGSAPSCAAGCRG